MTKTAENQSITVESIRNTQAVRVTNGLVGCDWHLDMSPVVPLTQIFYGQLPYDGKKSA